MGGVYEIKNTYKILVEKRKKPLGKLGVGGRILFKWIVGN
jgi:hypothetical protein